MEKKEIKEVIKKSKIGYKVSESGLSIILNQNEDDLERLTKDDLDFLINNRKLANPELIGFISLLCPLFGRSYYYENGVDTETYAESLDFLVVVTYLLLISICTTVSILNNLPIIWSVLAIFNVIVSYHTRYCVQNKNALHFIVSCLLYLNHNGSDGVKDFLKNMNNP